LWAHVRATDTVSESLLVMEMMNITLSKNLEPKTSSGEKRRNSLISLQSAASKSTVWGQVVGYLPQPYSFSNSSTTSRDDQNLPPWAYMINVYQQTQAAHQYNNIRTIAHNLVTTETRPEIKQEKSECKQKKKLDNGEMLAYSKLINRARVRHS
jgi:hypothetical protein